MSLEIAYWKEFSFFSSFVGESSSDFSVICPLFFPDIFFSPFDSTVLPPYSLPTGSFWSLLYRDDLDLFSSSIS